MTPGFFQFPMQKPIRSGAYMLPSGQFAYYCKYVCGWHAAADTVDQAIINYQEGKRALYSEWKGK